MYVGSEAPAHSAHREMDSPPPAGCRARPAQARGLLDRPFMLGAVVPDSQHCHRPKGWLAHTPHSSHRAAWPADSPQVYLATMALLNHRPDRMIAESGTSAPVSIVLLSSENVRPSAQGKCPLVWC